MQRVSAPSVASVVEQLLAEQRKYCIEYNKYFSNHATWIAVLYSRIGKGEDEVRRLLDEYTAKIKAEPMAAVEAVDPAERVNMSMTDYDGFVAYFDKELEKAIQETGSVSKGIEAVCRAHVGRVSRGLGAGAFHPILELGIGVEGNLPTAVSNGLAYMHARCWRDSDLYEVQHVDSPANPLLATVKAWCLDVAATVAEVNTIRRASDEFPTTKGQQRMLAMLKHLPAFKNVPVSVPRTGLLEAMHQMFIFAAAAVVLTGNEFLVVHGFTSMWATYHVAAMDLDYEMKADLVAAWMRGFFTAFAGQGFPDIDDVAKAADLVGEGKYDEVLEMLPTVEGVSWEQCIAKTETMVEEEHCLKGVWMLRELADVVPEGKRIFLNAAHSLAYRYPEDPNGGEGTLRFNRISHL
eukprot:TRINITY_DN1712_c0_g1_i1.p1 TRINITY_DN1712_c0_g1~~TRINITY_DN1712_c0_g1_i1.p1  ORF type:complete len:407 (+),score=116.56 TRINITY_DN1712_c0_g1_i1:58-1278(+)